MKDDDDHEDDSRNDDDAKRNRAFDGFRAARTPEAHALIAEAIRLTASHRRMKRAPRQRDREKFAAAVASIILDAAHHALTGKPGGIHISRNKAMLASRDRYTPPCFGKPLPSILDAMETAGLIASTPGDYMAGLQSSFRAGPALLAMIARHGIAVRDFTRDDREEVLILRGPKVRHGRTRKAPRLDYPETDDTTRLREDVRAINAHLASADIELVERFPGEWQHIDVGERRVTRVFNNGRWDHGGRLGGRPFWLALSREDRLACLRIGGQRVVGLDFNAMFLRLAYARCGLMPPAGDPYDIPDFEGFRAGCKRLISARLFDAGPRRSKPRDTAHMLPPRPIGELLNAIEAAHPAIRHLFGCGIGFELMHVESCILVEVLRRLREQGIVGLRAPGHGDR